MRTYGPLSGMLFSICVIVSAPLALIACNVLNQGSPTTSAQVYQASTIEVVYSKVPAMIGEAPLSPLFGDWPEHNAAVARLALALDTATPITPTEHLLANHHGRYLRIHLRDGTEVAVRQVAWCEQWSRMICRGSKSATLTDIWWVDGKGMVESSDLGLWWEDMPEFMVPIGNVRAPKTIKAGELFTLTLCCWDDFVQADRMNLSLVSADGFEIDLGEIPVLTDMQVPEVDYQWQGIVPEQTPSGRYWWRVSSEGFSELVDDVQLE